MSVDVLSGVSLSATTGQNETTGDAMPNGVMGGSASEVSATFFIGESSSTNSSNAEVYMLATFQIGLSPTGPVLPDDFNGAIFFLDDLYVSGAFVDAVGNVVSIAGPNGYYEVTYNGPTTVVVSIPSEPESWHELSAQAFTDVDGGTLGVSSSLNAVVGCTGGVDVIAEDTSTGYSYDVPPGWAYFYDSSGNLIDSVQLYN